MAETSLTKPVLSEEILQERIESPIQSEGLSTVDLRNFAVDLTSKNATFRDRFYQLLQTKSNRSKQPIGIDLSNCVIQGNLAARELGLQTPLNQAALSSLLNPTEREQLKQDERFLFSDIQPVPIVTVVRGAIKLNNARILGTVDFSDTFFLQRLEAAAAIFEQVNSSQTRFGRAADFGAATFHQDADFSRSTFLGKSRFSHSQFQGVADFSGSTFGDASNWSGARFAQLAQFISVLWLEQADFSQVNWGNRVLFSQSHFRNLSLANSTFEQAGAFRGVAFQESVEFQDVKLLDQIDFSNAIFAKGVRLNVAGLAFDSERAKVLGDTGTIGQKITLPTLLGNEAVLRNLVRNFRTLEQIPDANQIEYTAQKLRQQQLSARITHPLLTLKFRQVKDILLWLGLSMLLLLSNYGTSFGLAFGVGIVAIAYFGFLFWLIDRYRRRLPTPIVPHRTETVCMTGSCAFLTLIGVAELYGYSERPWLSLACLGVFLLPPLGLVVRLYQQGRYHKLLETTYFVEDGSMRQLRLLIVRLPIMPRFPFFRDRYEPILWNSRWNWLNYYDLSLNNFIKLGFNDIRVRDQHLPGIVSILVWYQWSLGLLYVALLLWTLSRTIPGLNLLIYLK